MVHVRKMYSVTDFFGDFAGIFEFLILIVGLLMFPLNQHVFYMSELPKLYSDSRVPSNKIQTTNT